MLYINSFIRLLAEVVEEKALLSLQLKHLVSLPIILRLLCRKEDGGLCLLCVQTKYKQILI
ncbi:hypothetical protein DXT99_16730 [Pontibacter diazotrophicus]|uniref:Uncharacterized protein n=1 Tax=Pontibacter diazotrophicus TaxID=1400979 RepID=A0A3D8L9A4_9BACT|nr:hypothetical protein DXT99_16730 [Pontibacter diazotrophicus]